MQNTMWDVDRFAQQRTDFNKQSLAPKEKSCQVPCIWGGTCILWRLALYCSCRMCILAFWTIFWCLPTPPRTHPLPLAPPHPTAHCGILIAFDFGCDLTHLHENCDLVPISYFFVFFSIECIRRGFSIPPIKLWWRVSGERRGYTVEVEGIRRELRVSGRKRPAD